MSGLRLIVIGAGPIGIEAALGGLERGHDVCVLEAAAVGAHLRRWGSARFFTPFGMNTSARLRERLGAARPHDSALLTGPEFAAQVLEPVAHGLGSRLHLRHRVRAVGRARLLRHELPRHPLRAARGFRLLADTPAGEAVFEADAVLDASGVYAQPSPFGPGGMPACGERAHADAVVRDLGQLTLRLPALAGARVLLVGHGHSAATALGWLAALTPQPCVIWATRSGHRRPCVEIANDPLAERAAITAHANRLAEAPPPFLSVERRAHVEAIARESTALRATLSGGRTCTVDLVASFTGYRPDQSIAAELALEISPVSEGAARLERALAGITDCLAVPRVSAADLASGEPGFHLIGAKSYGRLPSFLLRSGLCQLETILDSLGAPE